MKHKSITLAFVLLTASVGMVAHPQIYKQSENSQYSHGSETGYGKPYGCMVIATPQSAVDQGSYCGGGPDAVRFTITNNDAVAIDCAFAYDKNPQPGNGMMLEIKPHETRTDNTCKALSRKVTYTCYQHDARAQNGRLCVTTTSFK